MSITQTKQGGIKTRFEQYSVSAVYVGNKSAPWATNNCNNSRVSVVNLNNKKRINFDFWGSLMNPALCTKYDLLNDFYCFISDALSGQQDFFDFCGAYGYDDDSIRARCHCCFE